jgi:hypothetical protein
MTKIRALKEDIATKEAEINVLKTKLKFMENSRRVEGLVAVAEVMQAAGYKLTNECFGHNDFSKVWTKDGKQVDYDSPIWADAMRAEKNAVARFDRKN